MITFNCGSLSEDFAFAEEALELSGCGFRGVGGVADVAHLGVSGLVAEVAADRSSSGDGRVGRSEEIAHFGDDVFASESEGDDGTLLHEVTHVGEEGHLRNVRVVLSEDFIREGEHFDALDLEPSSFVTSEDGADVSFGDRVGFEEDESCFDSHVVGELAWMARDSKAGAPA